MAGYTNDWKEEDFLEPPGQILEEDDPWADSQTDNGPHDFGHYERSQSPEPPSLSQPQDRPSDTVSGTHPKPITSAYGDGESSVSDSSLLGKSNGDNSHITLTAEEGPADEDIWRMESEDGPPVDESDYSNNSMYDEPEPLAEYASGLRERLYAPDGDISELSQKIRIDEFIASIDDATEIHQSQIAELLRDCSAARLRRWLPWLRDQYWTGHSLLLFLEFRLNHWQENPQWWESSFWSSWLGHWWAESGPGVLSLDATYALVHDRINYSPDEVIDETWLKDWDDFAAWRLGVSSFANYAVFRAGLDDGDDWRNLLRKNAEASLAEESNSTDRGNIGLATTSEVYKAHPRLYGVPPGFAVQDWYDPSEWDDNLGYASEWLEATHPYLSG